MDSEIYKDHYKFEWEHRSHLISAINIPIAVATVLGGAVLVLAQKYPFSKDLSTYIFSLLLSISAVSLIVAICFLFKAIHGYKYQRIPTPIKLKKYYDELCAWWKRNEGTEKNAKKDLKIFINERMAEAVEINARNNKNKSAYIYISNTALFICLIFLTLSSIPYIIKVVNQQPEIIKVELVQPNISQNRKEVAIMPDNDDNNQEPTYKLPNVPTPTYIEPNDPKPVGPPNEEVKEHKIIPTSETIELNEE